MFIVINSSSLHLTLNHKGGRCYSKPVSFWYLLFAVECLFRDDVVLSIVLSVFTKKNRCYS